METIKAFSVWLVLNPAQPDYESGEGLSRYCATRSIAEAYRKAYIEFKRLGLIIKQHDRVSAHIAYQINPAAFVIREEVVSVDEFQEWDDRPDLEDLADMIRGTQAVLQAAKEQKAKWVKENAC